MQWLCCGPQSATASDSGPPGPSGLAFEPMCAGGSGSGGATSATAWAPTLAAWSSRSGALLSRPAGTAGAFGDDGREGKDGRDDDGGVRPHAATSANASAKVFMAPVA